MKLFGRTDIGKRRQTNQDMFGFDTFSDWSGYGVVCDGMGGENGGQVASAIADRIIQSHLKEHFARSMTTEDCRDLVINAVSEANLAVYEKAQEDAEYRGMGTTCVLVLVHDGIAHIAHVGDSRVYISDREQLLQLTTDHSVVQALLDAGKITEEEALTHPRRNMITRAVGVDLIVDIDYLEISHIEDRSLLLCSDGLTNCCHDDKLQQLLQEAPFETVCDRLIEVANENGGVDNITAVLMTDLVVGQDQA